MYKKLLNKEVSCCVITIGKILELPKILHKLVNIPTYVDAFV